ncbi:MAG TPA: PAS domain-containing protein, partial [Longimicrobium sp.]|nr:PAS domain-containing protein [Longimicrobium sp.]
MASQRGPRDGNAFHRVVAEARARVDLLRRRVHEQGPGGDATLLAELLTAQEELQMTGEHLRLQNEELALSEAALERERLRYWELFQQAPDAYLVTDPAGLILEANHAASALLNVPARRLIRKPLGVFVPGLLRRDFRTRLTLAAELGRLDDWETALQPRRRDAVEVSCTVAAVRDAQGGVQALRWLLRDVTERRRAEADRAALAREEAARAEAQRQRAFLEAVVRQMPGGVLIARAPDGRIAMHNAEAERILGQPVRPLRISEYGRQGLLQLDGTPLCPEEHALARSLLRGETVAEMDALYPH